MIAGKHVHPFSVLLHDRPHGVQTAPEIRQVTGGEVVIRFDGHQVFERGLIAVDVRENEQLHKDRSLTRAAR